MNPLRREDLRLVTGDGRYTADWNLPEQLHAAFVRADRAHARILSIDVTQARARPGVRLVLTADDLQADGFKSLPNSVNYPGVGGQAIRKPFHPVLARDRVRYVGEAVALIVADSAAAAEDARDEVIVDYEDLPAVVGFDDAIREGAVELHENVPGNLAFEFESGDEAAVEDAFARATYTSTLTVDSQRLVGNALEPRACLVQYETSGEAASGRYTFHLPMQGAGGMKSQLTHVSGLDKAQIAVVAQDVGGSFGLRGGAYPEYFALMVAAREIGRPVKWVGTRGEVFTSDHQGRALSMTGRLALDAEGRFLAIRWDHRADLGAYGGPFGSFIATKNMTVTIGGVYRIPAMYARSTLAYTNAAPISAYRGAGRPDIAFAIERLIDHAAREHGFDRIELRRLNFVPRDAMPYKTPNAGTYDSGDFEGVMDDALRHADWDGFPARRATSERAGKLRGLGIATYLEAGGGGAAPKDEVAVRFDRSGAMTLYAVTQSSGQGHETVYPQIVAETLGIGIEHVRFHPGPPSADLVGNGTGGSRGVLGTGSAFKLLAQKLIDLSRMHAATLLHVEPDELRYSEGRWYAGDRVIGFLELAHELAGRDTHPFDTTASGTFGTTYPNGCHIAEVEIDPETGASAIARYTAVDDLGTVINPTLVEGQVHGGVAQGAGQVFGEHAVYDRDTGQLVTASFADYYMPRSALLPDLAIHEHPVPTKENAIGAKGVGEAGCTGSLPALANAVMDALSARGVQSLQLPFSPSRVWNALHAAAGDVAET